MRRYLIISALSVLTFNTAVAGLLTLLNFEPRFWINLVFSQCVGISMYAINAALMFRIGGTARRILTLAFTLPASAVLGAALAAWITAYGDWSEPHVRMSPVIGLFFGAIGTVAYLMSERIGKLDAEIRQRRMNQIESEKRQIEAHLKLLQAQIEPHFLFNTLANVGSLIESDPALAKRLLDRLNDWLRVALARARSDSATLGDELEMLDNYLQIMAIRFGERLRWRIEVPEEARRSAFPPMLLQPLVENAVRHGIEPKLGGGEIGIRAAIGNGRLRLEVSDSGMGLAAAVGSGGTGLANVRARLTTLFGPAGKLTLENNALGGATATLELPL